MSAPSNVCVARTDAPRSYSGSAADEVARCVVQLLEEAGRRSGREGRGLSCWIKPGMRVFVLCNFVQERRWNQTQAQLEAKCTHGVVVRAVCDELLRALGGQGSIAFGNAPLQSTHWESVLRDTGAAEVAAEYQRRGLPVRAVDLRMFVRHRTVSGWDGPVVEREADRDCRTVELGETSRLAELSAAGLPDPPYRVMDYDPSRTIELQGHRRHTYLIHREILEADVIVSLPKLKTHEKVGITCGIKGFVGAVGLKDCLAHHRLGGPARGGDEYPTNSWFRYLQSVFHDSCQRHGGRAAWQRLGRVIDRNLTRVLSRLGAVYGGAWEGNDTCWRMAWDLARILHFADRRGAVVSQAQRTHLCLIDGIVAGEGRGPLSPDPVGAGTLIFADHVGLADTAAAKLMGYDPAKIPLVREGIRIGGAFLSLEAALAFPAALNGIETVVGSLPSILGRPFLPPPGWPALLQGLASYAA